MKQHYYLIAGLVIFSQNEQDDMVQSIMSNAIVRHEDANLPAHRIGKAQQNLQVAFHQKFGGENLPLIRDVVITNASYIGYMSEEEFQFNPHARKEVGNV